MGFRSAIARSFSVGTNEAPEGDHSADVTPPSRARSADVVSVERALTLPAVFRAIQIIAGMGAQLSLESWRGGARVTPAPALVTQPDPWRSLSSFLERLLVALATDGNAFILKHRGPLGPVVALEALDPRYVFIRIKPDTGVKTYEVFLRTGKVRTYTADQIEHIWGLEVPGFSRGLGPIGACAAALGGILDVREYADNWFDPETSDVPSGVLSSDQPVDKTAAKEYKRRWYETDEGDVDHGRKGPRLKVMGHGLAYTPIALKPEEAQWLESSAAGVLDVARMFGLPGDYLLAAVEGSSLTYSNLEMIDAQFLRTTLFPVYLRKIEAALTNCAPNGQTVKFNTDALLRPDAKTRAEIDKTYIDAGVYDPQHVRDRDGLEGPAPARPVKPAPATKELPA